MATMKEETREEEDEDDVEDLVSAINYNTITSMAALKEMLGTDSRTNHEDVSWFQHYFLRHVNRLPSRSQYAGRRLSECIEEDEGQDVDQKIIEPVENKTEELVRGVRDIPTKQIGCSEPTSPCYSVPSSPRKAQSHETLPMSPKPSRRTSSPHFDKHFFEAGLIEMKSQASSTSTLDYDSNDEVWIKRTDSYESNRRSRRRKELGSQSADDSEGSSKESHRPRSGTWDQSRGRGHPRSGSGHSSVSQPSSKSSSKATTPVGDSSSSRDRRSSEDESTVVSQNGHSKKAQSRTPTQSPSRKAGGIFLDAFRPRSKSDATTKTTGNRKSTNIISQMKNVVQYSLMSPTSSGRSSASGSSSSTETDVNHLNRYHHTPPGHSRNDADMAVAGNGGRRYRSTSTSDTGIRSRSDSINSRGAVSKVIDLFRYRSNSAVSAEDKRRAKAAAYHQHNTLSHGALLRRGSLDPDRRRLSLGPSIPHRGSDVGLDPNHAAILFRDSRGLPVADPFLEKVNISDLEEDECQIFVKFFKFHKCYDLIPTSAKLVVFDTQLLVKKAFFALVDNGVRAAPLWDSVKQEYVGMLTITDFIKILQKYYTSASVTMDELEEHKLQTWKEELPDQTNEMISIGPDVSLYEAINVLIHNRIHRLPVIDPDTGNVLYILTHKRILRFLFLYINDLPKPSYMNKTLNDLKIGTYENVETVSEETTIILALKKFVERRVSALPMVDETNRLVDIFAKFDVINLAAERTYNNLDISLKQANEHRNDWFEGVHRCHMNDTLYSCLEKIVRAEVHRLVVVDDEEKVIGIISLSDLLVFLVLRPFSHSEKLRKLSCSSVSESTKDDDDEQSLTQAVTTKLTVTSLSPPMVTDTITSSSQLMTSCNDKPNVWREVTVSGGE